MYRDTVLIFWISCFFLLAVIMLVGCSVTISSRPVQKSESGSDPPREANRFTLDEIAALIYIAR